MKRYPQLTKEFILEHISKGLKDHHIAKIVGCSRAHVQWKRKQLDIVTDTTLIDIKINKERVKELFEKGLGDIAISKELNCSPDGVYVVRKRLGLKRKYKLCESKPNPLTQEQKEVLFGTLLGDGSLIKKGRQKNPVGKVEHCEKQLCYLEYKHSLLKNLCSSISKQIRTSNVDRNKTFAPSGESVSFSFKLNANPELTEFYTAFYGEGKKIIPIKLLEQYYSPLAMAIHYMDDGNKTVSGYLLATMCFKKENQLEFCKFLKEKYGLDVYLTSKNMVYIPARSAKEYTKLILPYFPVCMKYKLISKCCNFETLDTKQLNKYYDRVKLYSSPKQDTGLPFPPNSM